MGYPMKFDIYRASSAESAHPYQDWWKFKNNLSGSVYNLPQEEKRTSMPLLGTPDSIVGIEVEIENIKISGAPLPWIVKEDGSLRNNGWEYVTPPTLASNIPILLESLFKYLNQDIDFSERCSIHIHLNIRDMSPRDVYNLSLIYTTVEKLLFKFVGHERDQSIFCVPLAECVNLVEVFGRDNVESFNFIRLNWMKYCAINYGRMHDLGTIEFRHMHGTKSISKVYEWIMLILCMKNYAMRRPTEVLFQEVSDLNTNSQYFGFLQRVFPGWFSVLDTNQLKLDMEFNVSRIKAACVDSPLVISANTKGSLWESYSRFASEVLKNFGLIVMESPQVDPSMVLDPYASELPDAPAIAIPYEDDEPDEDSEDEHDED
jgi:hypothetical protein